MRNAICASLLAVVVGVWSGAAAADPLVSEVRGGISFEGVELDPQLLLVPTTIPLDRPHKASLEVLFGSPDLALFEWIGAPRPVVGATISLTGAESWAKAGLTWHIPVMETPFFLEATLGGAIHNGYLSDAPAGHRNFGCRTLIYEQVALGASISESMTASINFEHGSHAWICGGDNDGFNGVGFRLGQKF